MEIKAENSELIEENTAYIVRLYNEKGEHCASLLPCGIDADGKVDVWDLAKPDGGCVCCNISNELIDGFASLLGWDRYEFEK